MRGPGVVNMDFSLFRTFKITEKLDMQFRAEVFNFSNTPHFWNPDSDANSSDFGKITGAADDARNFRLGLRFEF